MTLTEVVMTEQERKVKDAFEKLYLVKYSSMYYRACRILREAGVPDHIAALCAEDAVHDTFMALWENAEAVLDREYAMAWINQVLNNKVADVLRREQWWKNVLSRLKGELCEHHDSPFSDSELLIYLRQILTEEKYGLICRTYLYRERPGEVCRELGMRSSTLSMRLRRAKEKIRKNIENDGEK